MKRGLPFARFWRNKRGVAAIEFAIVSVVMAAVATSMVEGWAIGSAQTNAQAAANAGALYYLQGGTDDTAAQSFAMSSWTSAPGNAAVAVTRTCTCAGAASACSSVCTDNTPPHIQILVQATGTYQDNMVSWAINANENARIR
jgi:Flp pilus assembly protein TadG